MQEWMKQMEWKKKNSNILHQQTRNGIFIVSVWTHEQKTGGTGDRTGRHKEEDEETPGMIYVVVTKSITLSIVGVS